MSTIIKVKNPIYGSETNNVFSENSSKKLTNDTLKKGIKYVEKRIFTPQLITELKQTKYYVKGE